MNSNILYWDKAAKLYDLIMSKDRGAYKEIYDRIRSGLNKEMVVLELATGTGLIAQNISSSSKRIIATDFSPKMISKARAKYTANNVHFMVCDASDIPFETNSFDAVVISNSLHIMQNPQEVMSEIYRVLKDDGILFAPNFTANGSKQIKISDYFAEKVGFPQYSIWTSNDYINFIAENGFEVTSSSALRASYPITYVEAIKM